MANIDKVAVIGAGTMGAGIAAQVANAGIPVLLLDIVPADATNRNAIAEGALERLKKADPAAFMSRDAARLVTPGNIEDHLAALAECDWIVEAVIERLDIKQSLYAKIEAARKPGSVVSSNTSTIPLSALIGGLPTTFASDFCITHFFNPPRYMRLLELVGGPATRPEALEAVRHFADHRLGKSVVEAKDRPGFIANRLGVYWLQAAVIEAVEMGLDIEDVDAIVGRPMGIPKTGVFGLLDLVGLDLMPHVNASLAAALPAEDPFHALNRPVPLVDKLIAEGYTGRKGKGGFYRVNREAGKRKEAVDLVTGAFRPARKADVEAIAAAGRSLTALLDHDSPHGRYAWRVLGRTLAYAAFLLGDAADEVEAIDEAMRLGYNWKQGPFQLIDKVGVDWLVSRLEREGWAVPPALRLAAGRTFHRIEAGRRQVLGLDGAYHDLVRPEGVVLLDDLKLNRQPVLKNGSAALWDIGDGVACFEFTSKMNSIDSEIMDLLGKSIRRVKKDFKALVIYNEGSNFSAGANLGLALFAANIAAWTEIEQMVTAGQQTYRALKYAPFPVVGAPSGMALGGGCEILLHCDAVQAHAETYVGLVEVGVGLVPGWGGCKEMLSRWSSLGNLPKGPMPAVGKVFETVAVATVAKSAAEAKELLFLRPSDGVTMNRARLLADAKAKALSLVEGYVPPAPPVLTLPGPSGKVALDLAIGSLRRQGKATPHDEVVSGALAEVLTGGDTDVTTPLDEEQVLELERSRFMRLVRHPGTLARIETMLLTGKPLRN
ncbi:3-hydroxyacyl-CoA dehydrogenase/enoyl-CoA hydratase family protein [Magnetospirillum molischianum]|uniref:3-hydroxyacyl-CoA dehydrogenase NAD-binding n=1 Tax=Magnetospirillum molischianum DSM 120 TaxID=1150626 RepID=H8FSX4_MAGML|nr:3-hydroxyacyl-CoA dehydrogenase/enoyl-CoA hydratase family protein [Magnetospirillum molischianum]CCG41462.1 3-hydroxyacyl-CoA dehydrogenase NAD-binding [Magnetospirillum molischianum DSM 120]